MTIGTKEIKFWFSTEIIDDNYLFYNSLEDNRDNWKNKALIKMKELIISEPILGPAIVESHEEICKASIENRIADVYVLQRHCLKDFNRATF